MYLLVQAMAQRYHLAPCDAVRIIEIGFLPAYLHKFAKVVLPGLQEPAHLIIHRNYFSDQFKFA